MEVGGGGEGGDGEGIGGTWPRASALGGFLSVLGGVEMMKQAYGVASSYVGRDRAGYHLG